MSLIKKHREIVESLEETLGNGWAVLKYPKKKLGKATYSCNAAHIFNMIPKEFESYLKCPICEIDKNINRKSLDYKLFMKNTLEKANGLSSLGEDEKVDVHHIYSIRMFPEVAYHPANSIVLNHDLHKDYHRYFSPYNTNGYTFFAWIKMRVESLRMGVDKVQKVKLEVLTNMNQIEYEISRTRDNEKFYKHVDKLTESITDKKLLTALERKAETVKNYV